MVGEMVMINVGLNDQVTSYETSHPAQNCREGKPSWFTFSQPAALCTGASYRLRGSGSVLPTRCDLQ